jgi:GH25 family lysozyme M1 (1,4-beta-N-acetylmuramidase)
LILSSLIFSSLASLGIDISNSYQVSDFQCLLQNGNSFVIIRGYQSSGKVDPNLISNIQNAQSAGFSNVDVYLFPCVPCGGPDQQINDLTSALSSAGVSIGTIWLDVETYQWSDQNDNQLFIIGLLNSTDATMGIYTNLNNWSNIVGQGWNYPSMQGLSLWYAHYDGDPAFDDFQPFGGWTSPAIKQYKGDDTQCGLSVDDNYAP